MQRQNRSHSVCFTSDGERLSLGQRLAFGGEGSVYPVSGRDGSVVKIYHEAPPETQVRKLEAMIAHSTPELEALTAWPLSIVSETPEGPCIGFVMASASDYKEAHKLYSPRDRKAEFDHADWRFLVRAASNVAKAFAAIHRTGSVIGDVNHSSVMIGQDATVKLIDCDSYQLEFGTEFFPCEVGEPLHTAPELYGQSFREVRRTPNHDAFGLAVLIFELLFMGKHPFAGAFLGSGDPSLEDKIRDFRFAYAANAAENKVSPPAASLSLDSLPDDVAGLFSLAFSSEAAELHRRPSAATWAEGLDRLFDNLTTCERDESHVYFAGAAECPWCPIELATGAMLFNADVAYRPTDSSGFDLESVWRAIESVKPPPEFPEIQIPANVTARPEVRRTVARRRITWLGTSIAGLLAVATTSYFALRDAQAWIGLVVALGGPGYWLRHRYLREVHEASFALMTAEGQLHLAESKWKDRADRSVFERAYEDLKSKKQELQSLPYARAQRLSDLDRTREQRAWTAHMENHRIAQHRIEGLNLSRCVTLASYGVESALDISEKSLRAVPTIGDSLKRTLLTWRKEVEREFTFDPAAGISPTDVAALDQEIAKRQQELQEALSVGANLLSHTKSQIQIARAELSDQLASNLAHLAQAKADFKATSQF